MAEPKKCIKCGSTEIVPGGMNTLGGMSFVPENEKHSPGRIGRINLSADMCLDCGFVEISGKVNRKTTRRPR